jgi:hypothetical protein
LAQLCSLANSNRVQKFNLPLRLRHRAELAASAWDDNRAQQGGNAASLADRVRGLGMSAARAERIVCHGVQS